MFTHNLNPIFLSLGPIKIYWYGLAYLFGALFTLYWLLSLQKKSLLLKLDNSKITNDEVWDFVFFSLLGLIVGARLFMLVWNPSVYFSNPLEIFKIWHGGMSFHGGLLGIIIAGFLFSKYKKISFLHLADALSFPAMLALAFGRIANFINAELVGKISNGFSQLWCVVFPKYDPLCRHPSTLYAALKRFLIAAWIFYLGQKNLTTNIATKSTTNIATNLTKNIATKKQNHASDSSFNSSFESKTFQTGFIFWNFIFLEGFGRFIVDFFREDYLYFGLSLGQHFSLLMLIIATYVLFSKYKRSLKNIF